MHGHEGMALFPEDGDHHAAGGHVDYGRDELFLGHRCEIWDIVLSTLVGPFGVVVIESFEAYVRCEQGRVRRREVPLRRARSVEL